MGEPSGRRDNYRDAVTLLGHLELAMRPWIEHISKLLVCLAGVLAGCGGSGADGASPATGSTGLSSEPVAQSTTVSPSPPADKLPALALRTVASGLSSPVFLTAPDGDTRLFIVERGGRIRIVQNGGLLLAPFLDIRSRTTTDGERGLLSMAFDPAYSENGFFYVYYTDLNGDIAIERYHVSADPERADSSSAVRILSIPHPQFSNHNGGLLRFGPDGYLYIGTGDGGGQGDPLANAQNTGLGCSVAAAFQSALQIQQVLAYTAYFYWYFGVFFMFSSCQGQDTPENPARFIR